MNNPIKPPLTNLCAEVPYQPRSFQDRVGYWINECFTADVGKDMIERQDRFLEEAFELVQSLGYDPTRIARVRDYVFARPLGDPDQELGGVMVTLAALCRAGGLNMEEAAETELKRVWTKVEKIRAKQAAKPKFQPEPVAVDPNVRELEARVILREVMVELGVCDTDLDVFDADTARLDGDYGDDYIAVRAIEKALERDGRPPYIPNLATDIIAALEIEFGRQAEAMPEIETVGETDRNRLALSGTFDLLALARSVEHYVATEVQAINYAYEAMAEENRRLRAELSKANSSVPE